MSENVIPMKRIAWMDILRGLLILAVVIGHSTGLFNRYIYQFHMGAFFLVSGYMSRPEKRPIAQTMYHRFLTTYLPVFTATVCLSVVMALMNHYGWYTLIMGQMQYIGVIPIIKELLKNGNLYVWWLGAAWFTIVLFKAAVLNRLVLAVNGDRYSWGYLLSSVLLLLLGYVQAEEKGKYALVLVAHFYFAIGTILRTKVKPEINFSTWVNWIGLLASGLIMWVIGRYFGFTVDYPSYKFNHPLMDVIMAVNGGMFCFFAAQLMARVPYIKDLLAYLGRNTLPIMLFHFMWFNVVFWLLYKFGIVPLEYLSNFTPTEEIGRNYWSVFTAISILLSIILWKCLTCTKVLRIVWGQEKKIYNDLWKWLCEERQSHKKALHDNARRSVSNVKSGLQMWTKKGLLSLLCCMVMAVMLIVAYHDMYYVGGTLESCIIEEGYYEDGWCEDFVKLKIKTGKNGSIDFEGWTGTQLTGDEKIVVYCDGAEVAYHIVSNEQILFSIPVPPNSEVVLEFLSNFSFQVEPPDARKLSFVLRKLNSY